MGALSEELVEFLESGVSLLCGTRDAALRPDCCRAVGAIVAKDRRSVSVLLNPMTATRTLANLRDGGPCAMTASRPIDYRTLQIKGPASAPRDPSELEQVIANRYLAAFVEALYLVGLQRAVVRRLRVAPVRVIELEVGELFQQTPGPQAGQRLERA
jgi:hypothetical protein